MDAPDGLDTQREAGVAVPERVLVVESGEETAEIVQTVLTDEGYEAPAVVQPNDVVAEVRAHEPDALALHLPPDPEEAGEVLDALRVDSVARGVPVVATSTFNHLVDAARASYTVQETLRRPFDLDDLAARVERTLAQPPIQALVPDAVDGGLERDAEAALAAGSREMLLRLAERLRAELGWQEPATVRELLGDAPTVVDALDASMRLPEPAALLDERPAAADRLLAAAAERSAQGVDRGGRAREVALLREELWALIARELRPDARTHDVAALQRVVDDSLYRIVNLTATVFPTTT